MTKTFKILGIILVAILSVLFDLVLAAAFIAFVVVCMTVALPVISVVGTFQLSQIKLKGVK